MFHIDPHNHTGFAQVLEEGVDSNVYIPADGRLQANEISLAYALGHDVIEQGAGSGVTSRFYLYDGHGSTRALLNFAATVLQRYAYDAYGNQLTFGNLTSAANASTRFLFSGERTDKSTGWQNLQVRYLDPQTGRFITLDPATGNTSDPQSLHKYLYVHANPVMGIDPSGREFSLAGRLAVASISGGLFSIVANGLSNVAYNQGFFSNASNAYLFGAFAGPLAYLFPVFGVGLAGVFGVSSLSTAYQVVGDTHSSVGQKAAALSLVGLSALAAAGAGYNVSANGFWYNGNVFSSNAIVPQFSGAQPQPTIRAIPRVVQDINVDPRPPQALPAAGRTIGKNAAQNAAVAKFVTALQRLSTLTQN